MIDFETAVFIGDCKMVAVDGVVTKSQVETAFWDSATDLLANLREHGKMQAEINQAFDENIYPGLIATLVQSGLRVEK